MLDKNLVIAALQHCVGRDRRIEDWLERLRRRDAVEDSGAHDLQRALSTLLDGVAVGGSLSSGPGAVHLDQVLQQSGVLLFSLDVAEYPHATRKIAAWVLLAMGRLSRQLPAMPANSPRALLLVDEVGALGPQARHLRGLVGRARETGLAVVLATQGPSDLEAVDHALLNQVLQDTAWQLVFRQGSPADASQMESLFSHLSTSDTMRWSDGRSSVRQHQQPRVRIDEWLNDLQPGDAWLRVAPVDRGWRQYRVRVALPIIRKQVSERASETGSETKARALIEQFPKLAEPDFPREADARALPSAPTPALPVEPPECPPDLLERMGEDIRSRVERKWVSVRRELGPCLVWRDGEPTIKSAGGVYGRLYDPELKRSDAAHLVVWRRCYPDRPIPQGWTIDHVCYVTLCQRPDHLQGPVTRAENTRRRHQRGQPLPRATSQQFPIVLYERITRPTFARTSVSLEELVEMLSRFEVLDDKRRGRCWSPALYAENITHRGNAGVVSISTLVFDLDRAPPDEARLEDVCWIGHTTWSHRENAPRWRVVIPLARPIPVADWSDVWKRARFALCPEADPACKDPSRAYWLPSCQPGVTPFRQRHYGNLLEPNVLPPLAKDSFESAASRKMDDAAPRRGGRGRVRARKYMAAVVARVAALQPGTRNSGLNVAAWTLGHWIAAGALEQSEVEDGLFDAAARNGLVARRWRASNLGHDPERIERRLANTR